MDRPYKKIGKKFMEKAKWVYMSLTSKTIRDDELLRYGIGTRRGIVRYLDCLVSYTSLATFKVHEKLRKKAEKDPVVFDCSGGTYLEDEVVDTSAIFTDDVSTIRTIVSCKDNPEPTVYNRYSTEELEGGWDTITVDGKVVDRYTTPGTRVDWSLVVCGLDQDPDAGYYDMVYIPEKLWCFFPLYKMAIEPEEKKDNE